MVGPAGENIALKPTPLAGSRFRAIAATQAVQLRALSALMHQQAHSVEVATRRGLREINGQMHYLWRAVDHEGEVLEVLATKERDKAAAVMRRYGKLQTIVTDGLGSYGTAVKDIGNDGRQEVGRWLNNRVENSHQPFRRRERPCCGRRMKTLQKFSSMHNHLSQERHLTNRQTLKQNRSAALAE
jgi:putative transposase